MFKKSEKPKSEKLTSKNSKWSPRYSHGGALRNLRSGRRARPIRSHAPIHLVLKANRECLAGGFRTTRKFLLIHQLRDRYAKKFFIKIEQMSVQGDHIHIIIRTTRRSCLQNFLRVFSGQIAQRFESEGLLRLMQTRRIQSPRVTGTPKSRLVHERRKLWKHRPFTRIVLGRRALVTLENYVQLNEREAQGVIPYRKERLKGLRAGEWRRLWG
ncbi:hypothetical protein BH10BDE1_BH10BDE1_27270 [soil metagenome]